MAAIEAINEEGDGDQAATGKKSGRGKGLLISFVLLLLVGTGIGATLMFTDLLDNLIGAHASDAGAAAKAGKEKVVAKAAPIYVELGDAFVVNFAEGNHVRYLQVKIEAMTRDPAIPTAIHTHLPRIRNNLVFMLSALDYATLSTVSGKEKIRDEALNEVRGILNEEIGNPGVEALYFTSLVMQ